MYACFPDHIKRHIGTRFLLSFTIQFSYHRILRQVLCLVPHSLPFVLLTTQYAVLKYLCVQRGRVQYLSIPARSGFRGVGCGILLFLAGISLLCKNLPKLHSDLWCPDKPDFDKKQDAGRVTMTGWWTDWDRQMTSCQQRLPVYASMRRVKPALTKCLGWL